VDAYISPLTYRVGQVNKLRVEASMSEREIHSKSMEDYHAEIYDIADVVLCPSNWVAEGVRAVCPSADGKIVLCPYGSSLAFQETAASQRQPGRVLWAGREWFRKGLHDLAAAAEQLKPRFPHMDFRVAGLSEKEVSGHIKPGSLTYLGMLDRDRMAEEFQRAEMFVLPSYSEGMASVVVEAIAAGCPVIITHETGIDGISDEKNGMVVAAGDPQALKVAIEKIHLDQELREKIFLNSRKLAQEYSSSTWKARLTSVLSSI